MWESGYFMLARRDLDKNLFESKSRITGVFIAKLNARFFE
jgi:hypothetical protein